MCRAGRIASGHAEAATSFQQKTGITVLATGGPTTQWLEHARENADVVYSGAEHMMSEVLKALPTIDEKTVRPLYLRPAALPGQTRSSQKDSRL